jgi:hypothetical protein
MLDIDIVKANIAAYEKYDGDFDAMFEAAADRDSCVDIHIEGADIGLSTNGRVVVTLLDVYDNEYQESLGDVRICITAHATYFAF